jgi:hypothetical protein
MTFRHYGSGHNCRFNRCHRPLYPPLHTPTESTFSHSPASWSGSRIAPAANRGLPRGIVAGQRQDLLVFLVPDSWVIEVVVCFRGSWS